MQANALDSNLPLAKLGLAQIDLLRFENTNAITLLESTLQDVPGWMDALKVCALVLKPCFLTCIHIQLPGLQLHVQFVFIS